MGLGTRRLVIIPADGDRPVRVESGYQTMRECLYGVALNWAEQNAAFEIVKRNQIPSAES
jgi:hypothetical protein